MKIKSQKDFWSGIMFILSGIAFAWGATVYNFGSAARPGPGYFPFGLGVILAILGAIVFFKSITVDTPDGDRIEKFAWRPIIVITLSLIVFGFTLPTLGMFIALPLLVAISSFAGDEFHWGEVAINATILTVGSWGIFSKGLGLTIPLWPTIFGLAAK
ncbi:MAG: tripartite tricarboxylate transporter TctB family protein [Rubrivivax sp.]